MASETEPIWLTFKRRQLQAFFSTAVVILFGLVTVKSSPTICVIKQALIYYFKLFFKEKHFILNAYDQNYLNWSAGSDFSPRSPIILIEGILNGSNWEFLDPLQIHVAKCISTQPLASVRVGVLEVQVVLLVPVQ
jgi:hypothetical protein